VDGPPAGADGEAPVSPEAGRKITISERGGEKGRKAAAAYMKQSFEERDVLARRLEFNSDKTHHSGPHLSRHSRAG